MDNSVELYHQTSQQEKESDKNESTTKASCIQKQGTTIRHFSTINKDSFVKSCKENTSRNAYKKTISDLVELLQKGNATDETLLRRMRSNKLLLYDEQTGGCLSDRVGAENAVMYYQLAHVFSLKNLSREAFSYIQRCFSIVAETTNFLELNYTLVTKILSNCRLNITSELEVFNAAESWLGYDKKERKKFTKNIFGACLSEETLRRVLDTATSKDSLKAANDVITTRKQTSKSLANRFCSLTPFDVLFCGGLSRDCGNILHDLIVIDGADLKSSKTIFKLDEYSMCCYEAQMVRVKGNVYFVGDLTNKRKTIEVVKYSLTAKEHEYATSAPFTRTGFCACALLTDVYVMGGDCKTSGAPSDACLVFDTERSQFRNAARMHRGRAYAACAVFRGEIVVCGGEEAMCQPLRCVESCNGRKWTFMPSMIRERCYHSVAATSSKLFVVGGLEPSCEVYDASSGRFVDVKMTDVMMDDESFMCKCDSVVVGSKLYVILYQPTTKVVCYDVGTGLWSEEKCEAIQNAYNFCCVAVPKF